jgi:uncharacterized protein YjbI with pentapeptide repeats
MMFFDGERYLMSEQNGTNVSTKPRRNRQASRQKTTPQRPVNDDKEAWKAYWKAQSQPWRTEPEIDEKRHLYLEERRNITPDIEQGIYPFGGIRLNRADVEWLLATHVNGRGPVYWNDESQREREGLDLRGADLSNVDLSGLPLSHLRGGLSWDEVMNSKVKVDGVPAAIHLEGANLEGANLERASFYCAHLEGADFTNTNLKKAYLNKAYVVGANFMQADLKKAELSESHMEVSNLEVTHLEGTTLFNTHLEGAYLGSAHLEGAFLLGASLAGADLRDAHLEGTFLEKTHFEGQALPVEVVEHVRSLVGKEMFPEVAQPAGLTGVFFDSGTKLNGAVLGDSKLGFVSVADVSWGNVNLAVLDWSSVNMLGDEREARKSTDDGERIDKRTRLIDYHSAVRANRQLAIALREQGLNEDASRFAYRAQLMQRKVYWHQRKFGQYLGSLFLDLLSGYGYKVVRCFIAYALVITIFATIYHQLGTHIAWRDSFVISMTAFHGRGFFPEQFHPGDPQALAAAIEAFVGLLIEITLIATLTQRFFGK